MNNNKNQHTTRLMLLGGSAILVATLLYIVWLRHHDVVFSLADRLELRFGGLTLYGLSAVLLFDLFVFVYESLMATRRPIAKR